MTELEHCIWTLDDALADPFVGPLVGEGTIRLAQAVEREIPGAHAPLTITSRPWEDEEEHDEAQPFFVHAELHPLFAALVHGITDREPHLAKARAMRATQTVARLRIEYWTHVDEIARLRARNRVDEADRLHALTAEQSVILAELSSRGATLAVVEPVPEPEPVAVEGEG